MSAHSLVPCARSFTLTLAQVRALSALSLHHHGHPRERSLFTLILSTFYFPAFLLSVFLFPFFHLSDEQQPELNKKIMENLCDSATSGGEGTYDVLYLPQHPYGSTADTVSSERKRRLPSLHAVRLISEILERDCPRESFQDFSAHGWLCAAAKNDGIPFERDVAS